MLLIGSLKCTSHSNKKACHKSVRIVLQLTSKLFEGNAIILIHVGYMDMNNYTNLFMIIHKLKIS